MTPEEYVESIFPEAERRLTWEPCGYAINRGGPHGLDTKNPIYSIATDPFDNRMVFGDEWMNQTIMVLVKWLDGSPMAFRYRNRDVYTLRWNEKMPKFITP